MAIEIERKFLIKHIPLNRVKYSHHIKQGYIVNDSLKVIRVRKKADQYYLTIKGNTIGISRSEFEYVIPKNDAENLFDQFCLSGTIEKTRHYVENKNHLWEIDVFPPSGSNIFAGSDLNISIGEPFTCQRKPNRVKNPKNIKTNCTLSVATTAENPPFQIYMILKNVDSKSAKVNSMPKRNWSNIPRLKT